MVVFNGLSPSELAAHYYDFLNSTGIKEVKLAGCHTGSRFYEHNLPPLTRYKPEDLTHSYAMKFSQALVDLGLNDITVYGYRGALSDQKKKAKFEKTAFHSYVDLYRFFPGKTTPTLDEVRGHEVSVAFKDGALVKEPIITEDSMLDYNDVNYTLTY